MTGRIRTGAPWVVRVMIAWLMLSAFLLLAYAPNIAAGRLSDADDALRLLQVRDWIAGQSWFDVHQYRIAAPAGVAMHWSRLVDIPLAGMIVVLRPLIGPGLAETVTLVVVPMLTLLATLLLVGRLVARRADADAVDLACLAAALAAPLVLQMTPLRIDHHGWQVVMALVAVNGLAAREAVRGGVVIGVALAVLLAISIEGLPLAAVFVAVLALRGLIAAGGRDRFAGLATASLTLTLASAAVFLATRGTADLVTHCDQVSPLHIALFGVLALGCGVLWWRAPRRLVACVAAGATVCATLALYLWAAPQCRGGAMGALDPLVSRMWYAYVFEGMPVWHMAPVLAAEWIGVPLVGLIASIVLWRDAPTAAAQSWWRDYTLVLAGAVLVAALLSRASATACALAAIPTGIVLLRWLIALRRAPPLWRIAGLGAFVPVLIPALPVLAWTLATASPATGGAALASSRCDYAAAARALDRLPPTDLFMPLDMGPDILRASRQRVVATGHHRGAAAMHDVIAAFLAPPDEARALVQRRHATLIVVCPDTPEARNYRDDAPNGLMAHLLRGQPPGWLQPVDLAPESHIRVWRVIP